MMESPDNIETAQSWTAVDGSLDVEGLPELSQIEVEDRPRRHADHPHLAELLSVFEKNSDDLAQRRRADDMP